MNGGENIDGSAHAIQHGLPRLVCAMQVAAATDSRPRARAAPRRCPADCPASLRGPRDRLRASGTDPRRRASTTIGCERVCRRRGLRRLRPRWRSPVFDQPIALLPRPAASSNQYSSSKGAISGLTRARYLWRLIGRRASRPSSIDLPQQGNHEARGIDSSKRTDQRSTTPGADRWGIAIPGGGRPELIESDEWHGLIADAANPPSAQPAESGS